MISNAPDYSKGYQFAEPGDRVADAYHNRCGTKIEVSSKVIGFCCPKCGDTWKWTVLHNFTADQLATRFHMRPGVRPAQALTLVWVTYEASKTKFSALVPTPDAPKHERFIP